MSLFFRMSPRVVDRRRRRGLQRLPARPKTAKFTMAFPGQKTLAGLVVQKTAEKSAAEARRKESPSASGKQGNGVNELSHGTLFLFGFIFGFYSLCALVGFSRMAQN